MEGVALENGAEGPHEALECLAVDDKNTSPIRFDDDARLASLVVQESELTKVVPAGELEDWFAVLDALHLTIFNHIKVVPDLALNDDLLALGERAGLERVSERHDLQLRQGLHELAALEELDIFGALLQNVGDDDALEGILIQAPKRCVRGSLHSGCTRLVIKQSKLAEAVAVVVGLDLLLADERRGGAAVKQEEVLRDKVALADNYLSGGERALFEGCCERFKRRIVAFGKERVG
mmetsp:Transcript_10379/g.33117  ORF Transcript_10379/g.33117 Transcript_10379/m.33117 type:complete len:236 (+) Transcript_10379:191-898(+)